MIIVTHDPNIAAQTQRVIRLKDGLMRGGAYEHRPDALRGASKA